ncbi:nuclear transport factor 2 family protein [Bradyrhizobium sp. Pear77]|uniref:nuclear transport factor 2 family protein n=1 Tax=Bradyrhizobium altum TaxID=1571202 RepID=UPI001E547DC3|nr:nuclear transport factor 2 family protein [Bradyrhizobium altum]MCC8955222.1 nuclear transport factor 2 family protein [Bradyrhizobium altum]
MTKLIATIRAAFFFLLLIPLSAHAQAVDPAAERIAVANVMHDYFEAYSRGDMDAVMKLINVPFVVSGPKGFMAYTTADGTLSMYTRFRDAAVQQGYAKSEWIDLGVKLLGGTYAIAAGTYVRSKADGSELNRSGGTYLLNKVDGLWKIAINVGYPVRDAFKPE